MPICQSCKRNVGFGKLTRYGACSDCIALKGTDWRTYDARAAAELPASIDQQLETGQAVDWSKVPLDMVQGYSAGIPITTGLEIPGRTITEVIDVISAETAAGINIFRDILAAASDIVGGRSGTVQRALRDNRMACLAELRREALLIGADGVIGVDLDYSEFTGSGGMILTVATGTAVRLAPP